MKINVLEKIFVSLLILIGAMFAGTAAAADSNVLLVTIDTLRPDRVSCYSPKFVQTPRIDSLAGRGVLFEQAFAHTPMTLPSHANIFLGLTPPAHGVGENSRSVVAGEFTSLAEVLKARGYETGAFVGAFPLDSRFGLDQGFDIYDDFYSAQPAPGENYSERSAEKTIAAARAWLAGRKGPWFCWVHLWDPHAPYNPPEPFASKFPKDLYSGEVAYVDGELGKLLDDGKKNGWMDRTFIVLTGDHGESLGEHGEATHSYFAYNSTLHVPLIVAGPGLKAARVKDAVGHIDLFPTVCDLLGFEPPAGLMGASLKPALEGRSLKSRPIYIESMEAYLNRGWAPLRGYVADGKKFIDLPIPELYDLTKDPAESSNLAPGIDLAPYRKRMEEIRTASGVRPSSSARRLDSETRDRLRSLGYIVSPVTKTKAKYGPEDDLKTLLPLDQKLTQAEAFRREGKIAESVRLYEELIKARPDFAAPYDQLFQLYRSQRLLDEGFLVMDRGHRANPDNYIFAASYGIALVRAGRLDQGAAVLQKAAGMYDQDAEVWNSLGVVAWKKGQYPKALEYFQKALALAPDDAIINDNTGSLFTTMGLKSKNTDDVQRAQSLFRKALAADPNLASAHNGLGGVYRILGQRDEAIASWEKALSLNPNYDLALYNVGLAYLEKSDKKQALQSFLRYLSVKGRTISEAEQKEIAGLIEKCRR
jgi:arylsulfatase A-like enzyme/tetratricopeptide (TPR) repeat protein